jgi:hypothetical protein
MGASPIGLAALQYTNLNVVSNLPSLSYVLDKY